MKKETKKELCAIILLLALLFGFIAVSSSILIPKRVNYGATWDQFLKEKDNCADVLFFGSSISYCDVVPAVIWEDSGITSYVMAGPEQTIPITYYYLKQALNTQTPKVIFVEVTGVFFEKYQNFTKVNIGYMPWGANRFYATLDAAERAEWAGLFFPLFNYHSRWDALEGVDLDVALHGYNADDLAGYTFLNTAESMTEVQPRNEVFDEENYDNNIAYLNNIADLCVQEGITPVFYVAPTYWSLSENHLSMLKTDFETMANVRYINFNESRDLSVFDPALDYYDNLHFNYRGAKKFSSQLAEILKIELGLSSTENSDKELWDYRVQQFNNLCAAN
ncbi:MAG: hypothetical protein KBI01_02970 [Oscillospiraceae bacterium]|nr:hypothetical protein [Oscillospiraceae bacterium]